MKRILPILLFFCAIFSTYAQNNHVFKAKVVGGAFIPMGYYINYLGMKEPSVVAGLEFDYEVLPVGRNSWEKHWNYPTIGVAALALKLDGIVGKEATPSLGFMTAIYPYVNLPFYRSDAGEIGAKIGMGVALFNKKAPGLGSYAAFNFGLGINGKINLNRHWAITLDATYNPITNGNIYGTNATMNIFYGALGICYRMGNGDYKKPRIRRAENLPYKFMINATASMSFKFLEDRFVNGMYNDQYKGAIQATAHIDGLAKVTNCWATGPAIDAVMTSGGMRLGIAWANGFTMGRFTGLLDAGMNVYDQETEVYFAEFKAIAGDWKTYEQVNGTLYMRLGLRYRLIDNVYIQVSGRSFLHAFDCAEFGIGYSIPYSTARGGRFGGRTGRISY